MEAIRFDNVSKTFRLGEFGTGTLRDDIYRWWTMKVLRRDDPLSKVGDKASSANYGQIVEALHDVTFSVNQGDTVGIIGPNGAGKSTLLKLLARITAPTSGTIMARGRIASLLEVGTGFHPELTGRENVAMNGAILGMNRREIARKFDDIIDFAGVGDYVDTPVKRYSSGMKVRLGFAVAAFLESDILVVDEVLAVGDALFQRRALGMMNEVADRQGRTLLFVSHNMGSVKSVCKKGLLIDRGRLSYFGDCSDAITAYYDMTAESGQDEKIIHRVAMCDNTLQLLSVKINDTEAVMSALNQRRQSLTVEVRGRLSVSHKIDLRMTIRNSEGVAMASLAEERTRGIIREYPAGDFVIRKAVNLPEYMAAGTCVIDLALINPRYGWLMKAPHCCHLDIDGHCEEFCRGISQRTAGFFGLTASDY